MVRNADRGGRRLRSLVALLYALATLADRAALTSFPVRLVVLSLLRHAEAVAWRFSGVAPASHPDCETPFACCNGQQEAARLASSFRMLAQLFSGLAAEASVRMSPRLLENLILTAGISVAQIASALPANDTS